MVDIASDAGLVGCKLLSTYKTKVWLNLKYFFLFKWPKHLSKNFFLSLPLKLIKNFLNT